MDKYTFMTQVEEIFSECTTEEEIEQRAKEMIEVIKYQAPLSKGYLRCGINK